MAIYATSVFVYFREHRFIMTAPVPNPSCPCPTSVCCSETPVPSTLSISVQNIVGCTFFSGFPTSTLTLNNGHWTGSASWNGGDHTADIDMTCVAEHCVWAMNVAFHCGSSEGSFAINRPPGSIGTLIFNGDQEVAPELSRCCTGGDFSFEFKVTP